MLLPAESTASMPTNKLPIRCTVSEERAKDKEATQSFCANIFDTEMIKIVMDEPFKERGNLRAG
jgi:hypothetical protein